MMAMASGSFGGSQVAQADSAPPRSNPTVRSRRHTRLGGAAVCTHRCWKSHTDVNMVECLLSIIIRMGVIVDVQRKSSGGLGP